MSMHKAQKENEIERKKSTCHRNMLGCGYGRETVDSGGGKYALVEGMSVGPLNV